MKNMCAKKYILQYILYILYVVANVYDTDTSI